MVYLWVKNGAVYHHTNLQAAALIDSLTAAPDMEVREADFELAGGTASLVKGKIVIGKTEGENQRPQTVSGGDRLYYTAVMIAEGATAAADYADKNAGRQAWRTEIAALSGAQ